MNINLLKNIFNLQILLSFYLNLNWVFCQVKNINEQKLRNYLLGEGVNTKYNPSLYPSLPVYVTLKFKLYEIGGIDEKQETFDTKFQLIQTWYDKRLEWKPCDWNGVRHIKLHPEKLWIPDIVLSVG